MSGNWSHSSILNSTRNVILLLKIDDASYICKQPFLFSFNFNFYFRINSAHSKLSSIRREKKGNSTHLYSGGVAWSLHVCKNYCWIFRAFIGLVAYDRCCCFFSVFLNWNTFHCYFSFFNFNFRSQTTPSHKLSSTISNHSVFLIFVFSLSVINYFINHDRWCLFFSCIRAPFHLGYSMYVMKNKNRNSTEQNEKNKCVFTFEFQSRLRSLV